MAGRRLLVITPCRDEADHLAKTIRTMGEQTVPPTRWLVIDDGSSDDTPRLLEEACRRYPFLEVLRRDDRGGRSVGPGVVDAFRAGLDHAGLEPWEYICKLDGDLELPPRYFERLLELMEAEPRLGTVSGKVYVRLPDGREVHETRGDENSVGPAKLYRSRCYRDIGGFYPAAGWDGVDGHMCRLRGWIARSVDEPGLRLIHLRPMGSSQGSIWRGRWRGGEGKWFIGNSVPYLLATAGYRLKDRPYVLGSLFMVLGYFAAMLRGAERFGDAEYRRYLRGFERRVLRHGKERALLRYDAEIRARSPGERPVATGGGEGDYRPGENPS